MRSDHAMDEGWHRDERYHGTAMIHCPTPGPADNDDSMVSVCSLRLAHNSEKETLHNHYCLKK